MPKPSAIAVKTASPPVRRASRSRQELAEAILAAATELFASKGFAEPSIRDIAGAAGVTLPTLYRLFIDKRDIYVHAVRSAAARLHPIWVKDYLPSDSPEAMLYKAIRGRFEMWAHPNRDMKLVERAVLDGDAEILKPGLEVFRDTDYFQHMIRASKALSAGEMPLLRLTILNAFFNSIPNFEEYWDSLGVHIDIDRSDELPEKILSILYPDTDWETVAAACRDA